MGLVYMLFIGIVLVTHLNTCFSQSVTATQISKEEIKVIWTYKNPQIGFKILPAVLGAIQNRVDATKDEFEIKYPVKKTFAEHTFQVIALLQGGTGEEVGNATVQTWPRKPDPPKIDVPKTKLDQNSIDLYWLKSDDIEGDIEYFEAQAKQEGTMKTKCRVNSPTGTNCVLGNLDRLTSYGVSVMVKIKDGTDYTGESSDYSKEFEFSTTVERPDVPKGLKVNALELGKIFGEWEKPDKFDPLVQYIFTCKIKKNMHGFRMNTAEPEVSFNTNGTCDNLEHYQTYDFELRACIESYCSEPVVGSATTLIGPPGPPTILNVTDAGIKEVHVLWKNPVKSNGPLDTVTAKALIGNVEKGKCSWSESKEQNCTIKNLDFFTEYSFTAVGYNKPQEGFDFSGGDGNVSDVYMFTTLPGQPGVPEDVAPTVDGGVITVTWKAPKVINGDIELYQAQAEIGEEVIEKCETKPEELSCSFDQNLKYGTVYNVSVRAKTKPNNQNLGGGYGSYSTPVEVTTDESASVNVGLIVGLVVGAIVLIALIALIIVLVKRRNITPDDDSTSKDSGDDVVQL